MPSSVLEAALGAVAPTVRAELDKPSVLRWLKLLTPIYEQQGVLEPDFAPALHRACPERQACWRRLPIEAAPCGTNVAGPSDDGSIYWPWVGEHYDAGGLCVAAINLNHGPDYWSVTTEYSVTARVRQMFASGRRASPNGSMFAYRSNASAAAVLASVVGTDPVEQPQPERLVAVLDQIARVQTVKCSPLATVARNGAPKPPMPQRCAPRYMAAELAVLQPGTVLAMGKPARQGVTAGTAHVDWHETTRDFRRGVMQLGARQVNVLAVPHPFEQRGARWREGQRELVASLRERPITENAAPAPAPENEKSPHEPGLWNV